MRISFAFAALGFALLIVSCSSSSVLQEYEVECFSTGRPGEVSLKVWSFVSNPKDAESESSRNAVHAVLFRGVKGTDCTGLESPLCTGCTPESTYFQDFFKTKKYLEYVVVSNAGAIRAEDRFKTATGYKIGMAVVVDIKRLRQRLEADGLVRKMDAGF